MNNVRSRFILIATIGYAALGLSWILLSDQLLANTVDLDQLMGLSTGKGIFFVVASAIAFYFALHATPNTTANQQSGPLNTVMDSLLREKYPRWLVYTLTVGLSVSVVFVRYQLTITFGERPLLILAMFPIILSAYLGGLRAGLLATAITALGMAYFVMPPQHSFHFAHAYDLMQWCFLIINGIAVSVLSEALRRSQTRTESNYRLLNSIIASTTDAVFFKDINGRYVVANDATVKFIGKTQSEVIGRTDLELFPGKTAEELVAYDKSIMAGALTQTHEEYVSTLDGKDLVFWVTKGAVADESGRVYGMFGISRDITERKRNESALLDSKLKLEAALVSMNDAVFINDANGNLIEFNDAHAKIHRFKSKADCVRSLSEYPEIFEIRSPDGELIPPDRWPSARALRGESSVNIELVLKRKDTGEIWNGSYNAAPLRNAAGAIIGTVVTGRDITDIKQSEATRVSLEAQLREAHKMQAIGTLAGGIAHDFNNIIASILGNAELAKEDAGGNLPLVESIDEIQKAGRRGRDLVQQILSFSRRQPTDLKRIALEPVVLECVRLLRATLPKRISLEVRCAPDVPQVMADATQIQQALINLATNAQHAIPGGTGRIDIVLDSVLLDSALAQSAPALSALYAKHPGQTVRITVSDTGTGMDAALLQRIFEPFFTTKSVNEGTGLGLSVVHGIMQGHDGAITVESAPAQGSTFSLYFPAAALKTASDSASNTTDAALARGQKDGLRVLYIDDDELLVSLVTRTLGRRGYRVRSFSDQRKALALLRADPTAFDLVLTDYNMPEISGLDVARQVRALSATLPVAVTSGFIDDTLRSQAKEAGMTDLISKVDSTDELCAAVHRMAESVAKGSVTS